jgi:3-oxoacyl-[acyl-carrier-protein] synthase-3
VGSRIIGIGKAQPTLNVTNDDMAKIVETNDEWIVSRTGIHSRKLAQEETTISMASAAATEALDKAGLAATDIDLIVFATITPDAVIPSAACELKAALGCEHAAAFDINAACSGTIFALTVADAMMRAGALYTGERTSHALVVGAERLSSIVDWSDRNTCVLFGDGAGAVVLEGAAAESTSGVLATYIANEDDVTGALACNNVNTANVPFIKGAEGEAEVCVPSPSEKTQFIHMDGQRVFKFAGRVLDAAVREVCERAGVALEDIDLIVPHQANERIIKFAAKRLGIDMEKFQVSLHDSGNTSSASIPMALADAYAQGRINTGDKVVLVGFGAGLTYGAVIFEA